MSAFDDMTGKSSAPTPQYAPSATTQQGTVVQPTPHGSVPKGKFGDIGMGIALVLALIGIWKILEAVGGRGRGMESWLQGGLAIIGAFFVMSLVT
ncbi:hypothetical protein [Roseomonas genomospecies 6]|uniref:Uncharacterized protein n=1 Tax=Roseomonas genomospecies 6 TaxID=214106 RepID=A0A9W7NGR1_9PROT|nr:hypothetical protein [Roseomonas genomospecies 6]KAA0677661.1 hypothetical protein DS843_22750 [Roseomonas genomospecies 6]